jgi:hypothetical protein
VSEPWAYCERNVIEKLSVPRADCERAVSLPWANCERTVYRRTTQISSNSLHLALYSVQCSSEHAYDFEGHVWRTPLQQKHPFPHHRSRAISTNSSQLRLATFTQELRLRQPGNNSCIIVSVSRHVCFSAWLLHRLFQKRKQNTKTNCVRGFKTA